MQTIKATGTYTAGETPTLTVSSGRGNTDAPEIHLILRDDSESDTSRSLMAWFDRDELLQAIHDADNTVRHAIEVGEPA